MNVVMLLDNSYKSDRRVEKSIESIVKAGHEVVLLAMEDEGMLRYEQRLEYRIKRVLNPRIKNPFNFKYPLIIFKSLWHLMRLKPQVIHCNDPILFPLAMLGRIFTLSIVVYDGHEYYGGWPYYRELKGINRHKGHVVWRYYVILEQLAFKFSNVTFTVSEALADHIQKKLSLSMRPKVVYNITFPKHKAQYKIGSISKNNKRIVHIGSVYMEYGDLLSCCRVFIELGYTITFVGNREVHRRISEEGIYGVNVVDYPEDYDSLLNMVATYAIGWLHVREEWPAHALGCSNKFFDYTMAGLPILMNSQTGALGYLNSERHYVFYGINACQTISQALLNLEHKYVSYKESAQRASTRLFQSRGDSKVEQWYRAEIK
jgi:glycosyltransferase involved in cell wall biosynthesis